MKKRVAAGILLCLALVLTACGKTETPPEPVEEPEIVEPVQPEPQPEPEPEPEPEIELVPGDPVIVEGVTLESAVFEEQLCVALEDLAQALDTTWTWEQGMGHFAWKDREARLVEGSITMAYGGKMGKLPLPPVEARGRVYVAVEPFCENLGLAVLPDPERQQLFVGAAAGAWEVPEGYSVPVLMYHGVSDEPWGGTDLFVRPAVMEESLRYLTENGYNAIWFEDLEHIDEIENPVILTFDDGYLDNYEELFPLLQKYQVKATIFVVTGNVDFNPNFLTTPQIAELSGSGLVSIQSHTVTHPYLASLSEEDQLREIRESQLHLARVTGKIPSVLCYPTGSSSQTTRELTQQYYRFGINMSGGVYHTGDDPYTVSRMYVSRQHTVQAFQSMIAMQ